MKRLFVGGYGGSGSRVCQMIAERSGYDIGPTNVELDFCGGEFVKLFDNYYINGEEEHFFNLLSNYTDRDSFIFKHGHFMYINDKLKQWFPDSKFILTIRNPLDNVMNENLFFHHKYGGMDKDISIEEKLKYYSKITYKALENTDYIFKLEDFCFDRYKAIRNFLGFLDINDDPNNYMDLIKIPESIGRYKHNSIIDLFVY